MSLIDFLANCCSPGTVNTMVVVEPRRGVQRPFSRGRESQRSRSPISLRTPNSGAPNHDHLQESWISNPCSAIAGVGDHRKPSVLWASEVSHVSSKTFEDVEFNRQMVEIMHEPPNSARASVKYGSCASSRSENCGIPSALHKASRRGNVKVLEYLLDVLGYTNVDDIDEYGETALHICVRNGDYRACELLLKHGARIDVLNAQNSTPVHIALDKGRWDLYSLLTSRRTQPPSESLFSDWPTSHPETVDSSTIGDAASRTRSFSAPRARPSPRADTKSDGELWGLRSWGEALLPSLHRRDGGGGWWEVPSAPTAAARAGGGGGGVRVAASLGLLHSSARDDPRGANPHDVGPRFESLDHGPPPAPGVRGPNLLTAPGPPLPGAPHAATALGRGDGSWTTGAAAAAGRPSGGASQASDASTAVAGGSDDEGGSGAGRLPRCAEGLKEGLARMMAGRHAAAAGVPGWHAPPLPPQASPRRPPPPSHQPPPPPPPPEAPAGQRTWDTEGGTATPHPSAVRPASPPPAPPPPPPPPPPHEVVATPLPGGGVGAGPGDGGGDGLTPLVKPVARHAAPSGRRAAVPPRPGSLLQLRAVSGGGPAVPHSETPPPSPAGAFVPVGSPPGSGPGLRLRSGGAATPTAFVPVSPPLPAAAAAPPPARPLPLPPAARPGGGLSGGSTPRAPGEAPPLGTPRSGADARRLYQV